MKRGTTDAETCQLNGWEVGDVLVGAEGCVFEHIQITAIGEQKILARSFMRNGIPVDSDEASWTLICRNWRRVK